MSIWGNTVGGNKPLEAIEKAQKTLVVNITSVTLLASSWASGSQTVAADGVIADKTLCAVITTADADSHEAYLDCGVLCTAQGEGTLTFTCKEVPETDLTVNVLILTKGG